VRQRTRQVTKLERVELPEDRRKGYASIETLKTGVDITVSYRRQRSWAEQCRGAVKVRRENPEEAETQEGIEQLQRVNSEQTQRIGDWTRP
jgi:hypothetical protein